MSCMTHGRSWNSNSDRTTVAATSNLVLWTMTRLWGWLKKAISFARNSKSLWILPKRRSCSLAPLIEAVQPPFPRGFHCKALPPYCQPPSPFPQAVASCPPLPSALSAHKRGTPSSFISSPPPLQNLLTERLFGPNVTQASVSPCLTTKSSVSTGTSEALWKQNIQYLQNAATHTPHLIGPFTRHNIRSKQV